MDPIEKQVMNEDILAQANGDPLETPAPDEGLEGMRQKMIQSHTRRQMSVAAKEKELDRRLQELDSMRAMMQQNQQVPRGAETQAPAPYGDWSPTLAKAIEGEPLLKELVTNIDRKYGKRDKDTSEYQSLKQELDGLKNALAQQQQYSQFERLKVQAAQIGAKYKNLDPQTSEDTIKFAMQNGIDLDRALRAVAPEIVDSHIRAEAFREAEEKLNQRFGGRLNGMEAIVGAMPKESASPLKKDGTMESMEESAMQALGRDAYIASMMPQPRG